MAKKSFMVLGAGRFGTSVARTLYQLGHEVLVIDENEDVIDDIADFVTHAIIGDCCDEGVLRSVGASNFDMVIVSLSENMQASILATVLLKEMNTKYIIARAIDKTHMKILEKVGADNVVMPEKEMGEKLARQITSSEILDYIELTDKFGIAEIQSPAKWIGKTLSELDIRSKYGVTIIAIEHKDEVRIVPSPDYCIKKGDICVMIGENENLNKVK